MQRTHIMIANQELVPACIMHHGDAESIAILDDFDSVRVRTTLPALTDDLLNLISRYGIGLEEARQFYLCLISCLYHHFIEDVKLRDPMEIKCDMRWEPVVSIVPSASEPIWTIYTESSSAVVTNLFELD